MPKLLNVNSYHYRRGGSDAVYFDHAALLGAEGWDNGFFSMQHPKNEATPWSRYFVDELEFGHSYSLRQKLAMAAKVVYSFEAQRKLRTLLQDFPADVAHLHCIYHHLSPSILPVLRETWRREQLSYIPNYVDAAAFEPQYEPGDYLLYFGRLAPEKGVATLLRAAAQAGVTLKLAGTGPEDETLRRLAAELGADAQFLGFQSGAALHALIRGARAVVLPSEWYENAPMSVLESFAFGKPVLGAQIGGIPEMIEAGLSGWTFASGDVAALAERLREIRATPDARIAEMGRAARATVVQRFHRAGYLQQMLALYAELGVRT